MGKDKENPVNLAVLQYLTNQNRPFSVNDLLASSILKEHGKAAIQKALDQLVVAGKVKEKVSNKQKAYVIDQDLITSSADSNVAALDDTILLLSREISEDEEFVMKAESQLKSLTSSLTAEEMTAQLSVVLEENKKMKKKLEEFSQNKVKVSAADFKKAQQLKEKSTTELRKRKRICLDILDQILENYPKSKKALLEEVGVETD